MTLDRRAICLGAILCLAAAPARGLEGTWGGAKGELTAQVIITGGVVIGFYWRGDYRDAEGAKASDDGRSLTFTFQGGRATLSRTGDVTAALEVIEAGKITRLALRRD